MPIERSPTRTEDPPTWTAEMQQPSADTNQEMHRVKEQAAKIKAHEFRNIKLPAFWRNYPKLWFSQLESEMTTYRVKSDDTKYNTIIRHLDEQTMVAVSDIVENPPATDKYNKLKNALIQRFTHSIEKQLRTLIGDIELGDKTLSALLREMRTLAGADVSDNMLKTLWLQRLPAKTQVI